MSFSRSRLAFLLVSLPLLSLSLWSCSTVAGTAGCFVGSSAQMPERTKVLSAVNNGAPGREVAQAVFEGDRERVASLLASQPSLRNTRVPPVRYPDFAPDGQYGDLLTFAVSRCDGPMIETLLRAGVPVNGGVPGSALTLAISGGQLDLAEQLLAAGASANAAGGGAAAPLLTAGLRDDAEAARLLLRHGAKPNARDSTGTTILQTTVDGDSMTVAEILIDAGADPWAVSAGGGLAARGIYEPLMLGSGAKEAARTRLLERIHRNGAPWPPPDAETVRQRIRAGAWPPAGSGLPRAPSAVAAKIRAGR